MSKIPEIYVLQSEFCRSVTHPIRMLIVENLSKKSFSSLKELSDSLGFPVSHLSQHVKVLYDIGVLGRKSVGRKREYFLKYPKIIEGLECMREVLSEILKEKGKLIKKLT